MMNWLRNNQMIERKKVEPGATFSVLENHWKQATEVMAKSEDSEGALTVISHLSQMISFLRLARGEEPEQSCKQFWLQNRCSDKVLKWLHALQIKGLELPVEDERRLVQMLQSLCELASKDGELLGYIKVNNEMGATSWDGAYALASLLLEYSLRLDQNLSKSARSSFILLIQLASRFPGLEKSLSQETGLALTNVVISGLSACFAQLPTFSQGTSEQVNPFIMQLQFVDSVIHAAPSSVASTIAECFTNAFLLAVIQPALTQSLHEEIAIVTHYLQLVCEHLSHPLLIRNLIMFIISRLLPTFIHRMTHSCTAVIVSTLSLLNVLLDFYCEDFWYEIILRYLIPQNHLMVSQRGICLPDIDFHEASVKYLNLLPTVVVEALGPDTITNHYVQYLNNESMRWSTIDNLVFAIPPSVSSTVSESEGDSSVSTNRNLTFPLWQLKYDGSDSNVPVHRECKRERTRSDSLTNGIEEKFSSCESAAEDKSDVLNMSTKRKQNESLSAMNYGDQQFTNICLQPTNDNLSNVGVSEKLYENDADSPENTYTLNTSKKLQQGNFFLATNLSDGYSSLDSSPPIENPASFGPFLDCLLQHLNGWSRLHPDVILMITEIMSTLAASRIPLVNSLLLDPSLILQPSYQSFTSLLNRIRAELDQYLRSYPHVLMEVWNNMNSVDTQRKSPRGSSANSISNSCDVPSSPSFSDNLADNIRKKINSSGSIAAALQHVFQRRSPGTVPNAEPGHYEAVQSVGGQSFKYVSRSSQMGPGNQQHGEVVRVMATRAIFFSHWLLELAAIAQQLCWKKTTV